MHSKALCAAMALVSLSLNAVHEEEAAKTVLQAAGEKIAEVTPVVSCVVATVQVYNLAKDAKTAIMPTPQEQAYNREIDKELRFLTAKKAFQDCLIAHQRSLPRAPSGRPKACEEVAYEFGMLGGKQELDRMTTVYNTYNK